jgi:hypothetical protein
MRSFYYSHLARGVRGYLTEVVASGLDMAFRQQLNVSRTLGTIFGHHRRKAKQPWACGFSGLLCRNRHGPLCN